MSLRNRSRRDPYAQRSPSRRRSRSALRERAELADQPITSLRVDGDFTRDVGRHCRYAASIHGTVLPAQSGPPQPGVVAPAVQPEIDVQASVTCPNTEAFKINDNVMATGPLTEDQLTRALERRAMVVLTGSHGRCVYVPEFALEGTQLTLRAVNTDCD